MENLHPVIVELALLDLQQVRPFQRPEVRKLPALQQPLDEPRALVRRGVGGESACRFRRRHHAEEIEVRATEKDRVAAQRGRIHAQRAQLFENVPVDEIESRRLTPHEVRPRRHEGQRHRHLLIEIAHEHRRLARFLARHQPVRRNAREQIRRLIYREPRDLALRAVGKFRRRAQLQFDHRLDQHPLRRGDLQLHQLRRPRTGIRRTVTNPIQKNRMLRRADREPLPALMRQRRGRFHHEQAFFRLNEIHPPPALFPRHRQPVEIGILPPQRELEAALPVAIAMTPARIASRLGKHRHHLAPKQHLLPARHSRGGEEQRGGAKDLAMAKGGHQLAKQPRPRREP